MAFIALLYIVFLWLPVTQGSCYVQGDQNCQQDFECAWCPSLGECCECDPCTGRAYCIRDNSSYCPGLDCHNPDACRSAASSVLIIIGSIIFAVSLMLFIICIVVYFMDRGEESAPLIGRPSCLARCWLRYGYRPLSKCFRVISPLSQPADIGWEL